VLAGVVAALLWQGTAELEWLTAGDPRLVWLPVGSPFALAAVGSLVPDAGLWVLGALLSTAAMGFSVGLGTRAVLAGGRSAGGPGVLACWMVTILGATTASLVMIPILPAYGVDPPSMSLLYRPSGWGLQLGWLVALVAVLGSRPRAAQARSGHGRAHGRHDEYE